MFYVYLIIKLKIIFLFYSLLKMLDGEGFDW